MRVAGLALALVVARLAALAGHPVAASAWTPIAYVWQDALVVMAFAALDAVLSRRPRVAWPAYFVAVGYVAVNVPVMRVVSTPLTTSMLRAARGPLFDSLWYYVTPANLAWMALVLAAAAAPRCSAALAARTRPA